MRSIKSKILPPLVVWSLFSMPGYASEFEEKLIAACRGAAVWIESKRTTETAVWLSQPDLPPSEKFDLYYGNAGTILFFLELGHVLHDSRFTELARRGADALAQRSSEVTEPGLYNGLAGISWSLATIARSQPEQPAGPLRTAADQVVNRLLGMAQRDKSGTLWNSTNDIFKGSAGIGLALLELVHLLDRPELLAVARSVGDHLLSAGQTRPEGQYWTIATDDSRHYPNFSHGTSGVAYFLIRLYEATSDARYKAAAVSAAELLSALAEKASPNRCLVFHHEPGGTDLFYLSWCHGPSGTARLFERLATVTGEKRWIAFAATAADSVIAQGAPEKRTAGYWNNFGLCCGTAGIGEFYLQLYRQTGRTTYLELACRCAAFLLTSASVEQDGLSWLQAENRTKPQDLLAQTGLMQGAAGIGLFLLHLYETQRGLEPLVRLPDFARSP